MLRQSTGCAKKIILVDEDQASVLDLVPGQGVYAHDFSGDTIAATNHYHPEAAGHFPTRSTELHNWTFSSPTREETARRLLVGSPATLESVIAILSSSYDPTRNRQHPWGDIISPPLNNYRRWPYLTNINRAYGSLVFASAEQKLWLAAGKFAPHSNFFGLHLPELLEWAGTGKELSIEIFEQSPNWDLLNRGVELTATLFRAQEHFKSKDFVLAGKELEKVLAIDPEHIEAKLLFVAMGIRTEQYCNGILHTEQQNQVEPQFRRGSAFASLFLGMKSDQAGRRELALKHYFDAIKRENDNVFGKKAAALAKKFCWEPCQRPLSHKALLELLI